MFVSVRLFQVKQKHRELSAGEALFETSKDLVFFETGEVSSETGEVFFETNTAKRSFRPAKCSFAPIEGKCY